MTPMSTAPVDLNDANAILNAALALLYEVRMDLAKQLWNSLKPPGIMSEDNPGFAAEIRRRCEASDTSDGESMSSDDVIQRLRE